MTRGALAQVLQQVGQGDVGGGQVGVVAGQRVAPDVQRLAREGLRLQEPVLPPQQARQVGVAAGHLAAQRAAGQSELPQPRCPETGGRAGLAWLALVASACCDAGRGAAASSLIAGATCAPAQGFVVVGRSVLQAALAPA